MCGKSHEKSVPSDGQVGAAGCSPRFHCLHETGHCSREGRCYCSPVRQCSVPRGGRGRGSWDWDSIPSPVTCGAISLSHIITFLFPIARSVARRRRSAGSSGSRRSSPVYSAGPNRSPTGLRRARMPSIRIDRRIARIDRLEGVVEQSKCRRERRVSRPSITVGRLMGLLIFSICRGKQLLSLPHRGGINKRCRRKFEISRSIVCSISR